MAVVWSHRLHYIGTEMDCPFDTGSTPKPLCGDPSLDQFLRLKTQLRFSKVRAAFFTAYRPWSTDGFGLFTFGGHPLRI